MQPDAHRARLDAQHRANLLVCHPVVARQHDQFAAIVREPQQRAPQPFQVLGVFDGRRLIGAEASGSGISGVSWSGPPLADMVVADIPRDVEHPGLETAIVAVGPAVLEDADEDLLDEVLGCRSIAQVREKKSNRPVWCRSKSRPSLLRSPSRTASMSPSSVTVSYGYKPGGAANVTNRGSGFGPRSRAGCLVIWRSPSGDWYKAPYCTAKPSVEIVGVEIDVDASHALDLLRRAPTCTPSWFCSTPSTIRNGSSTIDQPLASEQIGPDDDVGDAGLVLEREEHESFRRARALAGDHHARHAHAPPLRAPRQIDARAARRASPARRGAAPSDAARCVKPDAGVVGQRAARRTRVIGLSGQAGDRGTIGASAAPGRLLSPLRSLEQFARRPNRPLDLPQRGCGGRSRTR